MPSRRRSRKRRTPARYPLELLMAEPPLPDLWLGDPKAPVTIIEYASMTCGHCARFEARGFSDPEDELYRHRQGALRHCANSRSILWPPPPPCWRAARATSARRWSSCCSSSRRTGPLSTIRWTPCATCVKQTGMGQTAFDACLNDQALFDKIDQIARHEAAQKFGINATPTFFINGDKKAGEIPAAMRSTKCSLPISSKEESPECAICRSVPKTATTCWRASASSPSTSSTPTRRATPC